MDPTLGEEEEEEEEEEEVMRDSGNGGRQDAILSVACILLPAVFFYDTGRG